MYAWQLNNKFWVDEAKGISLTCLKKIQKNAASNLLLHRLATENF